LDFLVGASGIVLRKGAGLPQAIVWDWLF